MKNKRGEIRVLSFNNKNMAQSFRRYICFHKVKYNEWPLIDESLQIQYKSQCYKRRCVEDIMKHVSILECNNTEVHNLSNIYNINMVETSDFHFDMRTNKIKIKGYDTLPEKFDYSKYKETLEKYIT